MRKRDGSDFLHLLRLPLTATGMLIYLWKMEVKKGFMYLTHLRHSPPRPPHSHNPSHHRISTTVTHTCWWSPRSQISPGDTSVCLWAEMRDVEITAVFYGPIKAVTKQLQATAALDLYHTHDTVKSDPERCHSGQLVLLSALAPRGHTERAQSTVNAQLAVKQRNNPAALPLLLPICSSWHRVGLIQITLCLVWTNAVVNYTSLLTVQP